MSTTRNLRSLMNKLGPASRASLESAAGLCLSRTHYEVEIEHWLSKMLDSTGTEFDIILNEYKIDRNQFSSDLARTIDSFKTGNTRTPALGADLFGLAVEAWLAASLNFGDEQIRTGHVLFALLAEERFRRVIAGTTRQLEPINTDDLATRLADISQRSNEASHGSQKSPIQAIKPDSEEFVFVSYDRMDQEFVFWLAEELRKNNVELWIDQWAISPGDDWDKEIEGAIERCRQFLIVLTPDACESKEVNSELRAAMRDSKPIIPILRRPCKLPRHLLTVQNVSFVGADFRQAASLDQVVRRLLPRKAGSHA